MKKDNNLDKITRKDALKKMGKYAALTAVGTFLILNPQKAQAQSPPNPGGEAFPS
ncbi:hypothetical protein [uncultured Winogradskyella sp.]|uniref:hypothetical protein n=1 Tax=uncultured Winogradskyella sp. TaxID=395353 RepID=UPI0030DAEC5E|tara:strand:+ start:31729 stop:31893 length:165 start_codon:yes stop_codon:yes gene_type:complete